MLKIRIIFLFIFSLMMTSLTAQVTQKEKSLEEAPAYSTKAKLKEYKKTLETLKSLPRELFIDCNKSDCPDGFGCYEGKCYPIEGNCKLDKTECSKGEECIFGKCYDTSCDGVECPKGQKCVEGECVDDPCYRIECPEGQVCNLGECYDAAIPCNDGKCPDGKECFNGICL